MNEPRTPIGIRAEDKNKWERRAPLTPDHVHELVTTGEQRIHVQPSSLRVFPDSAYATAGAQIDDSLDACRVILGVKEIPPARLRPDTVYMYFSHVIKGQAANMPMLQRLMDLGSTLIDYEPITDARGRRLIFFGRHAGYAGMIDTLWALGQRLEWEGFPTPLARIRPAHQYATLEEAMSLIGSVGDEIRQRGFPPGLRPIVIAFTGSGNVSRGAQEIFDRLPWLPIDRVALSGLAEDRDRPHNLVYKCVLEREDRYVGLDGAAYDAAEYARDPARYRSSLDDLLPHITVFVNGIYWEPGQPRLITKEMLRALWAGESQPKLRVIGDITCDPDGSIEMNSQGTDSGDPVYVWDVERDTTSYGVEGRGPVIMAVDNLPCEIPADASSHFGDSLARFVPALSRCDWSVPFDELQLPDEIRRAIIVHRGQLTPGFSYLESPLRDARSTR